jgi:hypothetical protein
MMRGACERGERPQARIWVSEDGGVVKVGRSDLGMWSEAREMDTSVGSNHQRRLLVPLEGQSGAEGHDPEAQGRADRLKNSRTAGELFGKSPSVGISYPVALDQGRYIVRNKWMHLPVPFCETPV